MRNIPSIIFALSLSISLLLVCSCSKKKSAPDPYSQIHAWYSSKGDASPFSRIMMHNFEIKDLQACSGPVMGSEQNPHIKLIYDENEKLQITNKTSACVQTVSLIGKDKIYRIGSFSLQDLIGDIKKGAQVSTEEETIRALWQWSIDHFKSFCEWGPPYEHTRGVTNLLHNILSYSFGCCSDLNMPLLLNVMATAGIETYYLRSPLHVAVMVKDREKNQFFYADTSHRVLLPGHIFDFAKDHYYRQLFSDKNLAVFDDVPPQMVTDIINPRINFHFAANDEISFSSSFVKNSRIVARLNNYQDIALYKHNVHLGNARLQLNAHLQRGYVLGDIRCLEYNLTFPYALLSAHISALAPSTTVWIKNRYLSEIPEKDIGGQRTNLKSTSPYPEVLANVPAYDLPFWGRHLLNVHLCDHWQVLKDVKPLLNLEFQYNAFLLPKKGNILEVSFSPYTK